MEIVLTQEPQLSSSLELKLKIETCTLCSSLRNMLLGVVRWVNGIITYIISRYTADNGWMEVSGVQ